MPDYDARPTERFSDRVDAYVRFRPSYPPQVFDALRESGGLSPASIVADIGSGTAIFSKLLLPHCATVHAVEPNAAMRLAGEHFVGADPRFISHAGTAEATGLPDTSIDLVTAAQAFHWFDIPKTRREFSRILRPGGKAALIWNERQSDTTSFLRGYEQLLHAHCPEYAKVNHADLAEADIARFFGHEGFVLRTCPNEQRLDYAGLEGRLLSSSYAPAKGQSGHDTMISALRSLFEATQIDGRVGFRYTTKVYIGGM